MSKLYSIEDLKNIGVIVYGKNIKISKFVNNYNPKNLIHLENILHNISMRPMICFLIIKRLDLGLYF